MTAGPGQATVAVAVAPAPPAPAWPLASSRDGSCHLLQGWEGVRCGDDGTHVWCPALEQASARNLLCPARAGRKRLRRRRRVTRGISSLGIGRGRARGFPGAAPESRGPARPRVSRWPLTYDRARASSRRPRVKGTRLLGAGDVREKGEEKRGHSGTHACGGGATFAVCRSFVGGGLLFGFVGPKVC